MRTENELHAIVIEAAKEMQLEYLYENGITHVLFQETNMTDDIKVKPCLMFQVGGGVLYATPELSDGNEEPVWGGKLDLRDRPLRLEIQRMCQHLQTTADQFYMTDRMFIFLDRVNDKG